MTVWGSPEDDATGRHERRIERLVEKSKRYITKLNATYRRPMGSQAQSPAQERQLFEQARFDPVLAEQLFQEIRKRSVSRVAAAEAMLKWGKRFS